VIKFYDRVMPNLKEIDTHLERVHYWTDSPKSQYRNKLIFLMISRHEIEFGIKARWNYFESGHGKGHVIA